jgi:5,10-methylenetetrahydrofolate reductase
VDATKAEIRAVAEAYWQAGVRHIVALRGDMGRRACPSRRIPMAMPMPPNWWRA